MNNEYKYPAVVDMERYVIGAMLVQNGESIPTVLSMLTSEDFFDEVNKILFETIIGLYQKKIIPNTLSVFEELRKNGKTDEVGFNYLTALPAMISTTAYVKIYAETIKEKSILRKLMKAGEEISQMAAEDKLPLQDILDEAEKKIFDITTKGERSEFEHISPILERAFDKIRAAVDNPDGLTGVKTDFVDLDKLTSGFQKSDLILLAARPSMGKTALALNMAINAAKSNYVVALFSLEMSKEQLGTRLLSAHSGINSLKLNTGQLDATEFNAVIDAQEYLSDATLFIDDSAGITVLELRSKARQIKNEHGLDFIVIDYLQLMQGNIRKGSDYNRQQEISEISRSLKSLARELKVPILALSQLSRSVELRADKRPMLSDLRESGSLEQDADLVMFLYREEYYNRETENYNTAELVIAKNRNGPTSIVTLQFQKECMRFSSLSRAAE